MGDIKGKAYCLASRHVARIKVIATIERWFDVGSLGFIDTLRPLRD